MGGGRALPHDAPTPPRPPGGSQRRRPAPTGAVAALPPPPPAGEERRASMPAADRVLGAGAAAASISTAVLDAIKRLGNTADDPYKKAPKKKLQRGSATPRMNPTRICKEEAAVRLGNTPDEPEKRLQSRSCGVPFGASSRS